MTIHKIWCHTAKNYEFYQTLSNSEKLDMLHLILESDVKIHDRYDDTETDSYFGDASDICSLAFNGENIQLTVWNTPEKNMLSDRSEGGAAPLEDADEDDEN